MKLKKSKEYFVCKSNDYLNLKIVKGSICHVQRIDKYLDDFPKSKDWGTVLEYPTTQQLIDCIETGENKIQIIKALKQWELTIKKII